MLPIIPVSTIVALLAVMLVVTFAWIAIRFVGESSRQRAAREAATAEIMRRALARGRAVAHLQSDNHWRQYNSAPFDDTVWRMQGNAPGQDENGQAHPTGIEWTLAWRIAFRDATDTSPDATDSSDAGRGLWTRDTVQGQLLSWRCPSIRTGKPAFTFCHRDYRYDKKPEEITSEADGPLWRRWRLEAKDEALARRVFNPALCALLEQLPAPRTWNSRVDERTSIALGPDGLQADLGVEELTPELVELWIEIGERLTCAMYSLPCAAFSTMRRGRAWRGQQATMP